MYKADSTSAGQEYIDTCDIPTGGPLRCDVFSNAAAGPIREGDNVTVTLTEGTSTSQFQTKKVVPPDGSVS